MISKRELKGFSRVSNYFKIKIGPRDLQDSFKAMQKQSKVGHRNFFQLLQTENIRYPRDSFILLQKQDTIPTILSNTSKRKQKKRPAKFGTTNF